MNNQNKAAEIRKTNPDLELVINLADGIESSARELREMALWQQKRLEILGEKAGIVSIPDSFWKPYDDYKQEQAKQA